MSEITVSVVGSTSINPTVGNGDTVNVAIASAGERGPSGSTGAAGPANTLTIGTVSQGTAAATITGTAPNQVLNLVLQKGDAGTPATNIELQSTGTHIQWRLVGGSTWTNLVALSAITGPTGSTGAAGAAVELQASGTHIQWRYVGGSTWTNVVALSSLVGATGATGPQGPAGPPINLADETPQPLGVASAGTALTAARADHVHAVGSVQYSSLSGIPSTFAPSAHSHAVSDITGLQTQLDGKQAAGSYATLVNGTVPSSQLPSYVDDVIEYANLAAFTEQSTGKIYVARDTGKIYRWSGSAYAEISPSPGSTDSVTEGSTNLYYTNARAAAAAPVQSVAGRTGNVVISASDVSGLSAAIAAGAGVSLSSDVPQPLGLANAGVASTASRSDHTHPMVSALDVGALDFNSKIDGGTYVGVLTYANVLTITQQPTSQSASSGSASFSVSATSSTNKTISYQWQQNSLSFTDASMPVSAARWRAAYGNGVFAAISSGGYAASSADGATWTQRSIVQRGYYDIAYGNGRFVAISGYYSGQSKSPVAYSSDGVSWSTAYLPTNVQWWRIAYGDRFVAVGAYGGLASSADGVTWTLASQGIPSYTATNGQVVGYGNSAWIIAQTGQDTLLRTTTFTSWTKVTLPVTASWSGIAYGNGVWVLGNGSTLLTSNDGSTWTQRTLPSGVTIYNIVFGNGVFLAIGYGSAVSAISVDGITWQSVSMPSSASWYGSAFGNGTFVAMCDNASTAAVSANSWINVTGATSATLSLTSLTSASNNRTYRALVSSQGAASLTSDAATLTVT